MENKVVRLKYIGKHFVVPIVTTSHDTHDGQSSHSGRKILNVIILLG